MKYQVQLNEVSSFYRDRYMRKEMNPHLGNCNDIIEAEPFFMYVNELRSANFVTHSIRVKSGNNVQITRECNDEWVILNFVCRGDICVTGEAMNSLNMSENTNNLFRLKEGKINHNFRQDQAYEYFKVFLPCNFIDSVYRKNLISFDRLFHSFNDPSSGLFPRENLFTTIEMKHVIDQIKNSSKMGNLAPLYFDTKVQELICLLLKQQNSHKSGTQSRHDHYSRQLNEARTILEQKFQNPPSINELASTVGISATILKDRFKLLFGTTVYGYLFSYRMDIAKKLLEESKFTISQIAAESGYEHASHFSTAFKRKYGINPISFRKSMSE